MRPARLFFVAPLFLIVLVGCPMQHGVGSDAGGGDGGGCRGSSSLICVASCGTDAGLPAICAGTDWRCPPGTVDIFTCPPTCLGPRPGPDCVCRGTDWSCPSTTCPEGLNPWDPSDPRNACTREGATCSSGSGDSCGAAMFCTCESGSWSCAVAEPDPVCWCGRQPTEGDRCVEEGASCGECCPTAEGTGWPAMTCEDGHWTAATCPAVECPPVAFECPVDATALLGTSCVVEGASCGHACCDGSIDCRDGVWQLGAIADCSLCPDFDCGGGECFLGEYCYQRCGPDDGLEHVCAPTPEGCNDCSCIPLWGTQACEMIDGHPHVRELGFCG